MKVTKINM